MDNRGDNRTNTVPIFFIMGRPRSGTTLLRTLFDAHPNVRIPPEFPIFLFIYQKFRKVKTWDKKTILSFVDHVYANNRFNNRTLDNLKIDKEAFIADLLTLENKGTIQDFLKKINEHAFSLFPKQEILQIGDKNPVYSFFTKRFIRMFPDARFICILRDYRDNYLSMQKLADLKLEAPIISLQVARWRFMANLFLKCRKKYPDRFHIVLYEDLVTNQERVIQQLCKFIGISYDESVFDFFKKTDESLKIYPRELAEKFHKSLMSPVNTSRMNLWKDQLTEKEVKLADTVAGKYADILGYERREKRFNLFYYLRSRPMVIYGYLLWKIMILGSYLPYQMSRWFSLNLLILVRTHHYFFGKKANP